MPSCVMPGGIMAFLGCLGMPLVYKSQLFGKNDPLVLPSAKISLCNSQDLPSRGTWTQTELPGSHVEGDQ